MSHLRPQRPVPSEPLPFAIQTPMPMLGLTLRPPVDMQFKGARNPTADAKHTAEGPQDSPLVKTREWGICAAWLEAVSGGGWVGSLDRHDQQNLKRRNRLYQKERCLFTTTRSCGDEGGVAYVCVFLCLTQQPDYDRYGSSMSPLLCKQLHRSAQDGILRLSVVAHSLQLPCTSSKARSRPC